MRNFVARRPSPAMAVAFVALLAALSGTAIALPGTNTVDSGDIKRGAVKRSDIGRNAVTGAKIRNGSASGADVADNSLTGTDINESTLGQVPSANTAGSANTANTANSASTANSATTAQNADNAAKVNGLTATKISLRDTTSGDVAEQTIYDAHGLTLRGSCSVGVEEILASTSVADGEISSIGDDAGGGSDLDESDDDFDPGDSLELTPATPDDQVYTVNYTGGDGRFVMVRLATEGPLNASCEISGLAIGG
jgi:hypothetical protein